MGGINRHVAQIPQCTSRPYPTVHHFVTGMCTCVHIYVLEWCILVYAADALWDIRDDSTYILTICDFGNGYKEIAFELLNA